MAMSILRAMAIGIPIGIFAPLVGGAIGYGIGYGVESVYERCTGPRYRITEEYRPVTDAVRFYAYRRVGLCPFQGYNLLGGEESLKGARALVGRYERAERSPERVVATVP